MNNVLPIINQIFDIQNKLTEQNQDAIFERNFNRIFSTFEEEGFLVQNPIHEPFTDNRTDCEASIVGNISNKMKITKTIKPIVYKKTNGQLQLIQKAIVIVEKI